MRSGLGPLQLIWVDVVKAKSMTYGQPPGERAGLVVGPSSRPDSYPLISSEDVDEVPGLVLIAGGRKHRSHEGVVGVQHSAGRQST